MKDKIGQYYKAIAGLVGPGATALAVAWFVTTPHVITDNEWVLIITTALGGGTAVWRAPKNVSSTGKHEG